MSKLKTIDQIAQEAGCSKETIRKRLIALNLLDKLAKDGNRFVVNNEQEALIYKGWQRKKRTNKAASSHQQGDKLLQALKDENENLRQQIDKLTEALTAAQAIASQAQQLQAMQQQQVLKLTDGQKKPWYKRLFARDDTIT